MLTRIFPFLLVFIVLSACYAQAQTVQRTKGVSYQYCYCPKPNSETQLQTTGPIRVKISRFNADDISQLEMEVTKTDGSNLRTNKMTLTAGSPQPSGRFVPCDPAISESQIVVKFISRLFINTESEVQLFVNFTTPNNEIQYAGPITIYRTSNNDPEAICEKSCPEKSTTTNTGWNVIRPVQQFSTKAGPKEKVLAEGLINVGIIPTEGSLALLSSRNPNLANRRILSAGTTVSLPSFPPITKSQVVSSEQQFRQDNTTDETQMAVFRERSNYLFSLLGSFQLGSQQSVINDVSEIQYQLYSYANNTYLTVKKSQTDILNSELQDCYEVLLPFHSAKQLSSYAIEYIHEFKNYLLHVLTPVPHKSKAKKGGSKSYETQNRNALPYKWFDDPDNLNVYIYAFDDADSPPVNGLAIYCISQRQYDRLSAQLISRSISEVTELNLKKMTSRCNHLTSPSSKGLNASFAYYFIAVSATREVVMCNKVDLSTLGKDSDNRFVDKPYAILLYSRDKNCFQ